MRSLIYVLFLFQSVFSIGQSYTELQSKVLSGEYEYVSQSFQESKKLKLQERMNYHIALGDIAFIKKDYSEAELQYRKADSCAVERSKKKKKRGREEYDIKDKIALLYLEMGNYFESKRLIDQSHEDRKAFHWKKSSIKAKSLYTYAQYYSRLKQQDSAISYSERFMIEMVNLQFNHRHDLPSMGNAYKVLAEAELEKGNLKKALAFAKKNKSYQFHHWSRRDAGNNTLNKVLAHNLLAEIYLKKVDLDRAKKHGNLAIEQFNSEIGIKDISYVQLLITSGKIAYHLNEFDQSADCLKEAYNIQYRFLQENLASLSEYERERFYKESNDRAIEMNSYALSLIQLDSEKSELIEEMFNYSINTRGILLGTTNRIVETINSLDEGHPIKNLYSQWLSEKSLLAEFIRILDYKKDKVKIENQQSKVNSLEKEIGAKLNEFSIGVIRQPIFTFMDLKGFLGEGESFLNILKVQSLTKEDSTFVVSDSIYQYIYFGVENGSERISLYTNENQEIDESGFLLYKNSIKYKIKDTRSYASFVEPFEKLIDGKRLFVLNDGIYNLLNLQSIFMPSKGKYLLEELDLVTVTTINELKKKSTFELPKDGIVLLGRPKYYIENDVDSNLIATRSTERGFSSNVLSDLPGTEVEIKNIQAVLEDHSIIPTVLFGIAATEESLKKSSPKGVLHISTHGFFDNSQADSDRLLNSGLVLAGAGDEHSVEESDGILNAYEASLLKLDDVNLVVMSACETGLGKVKQGEGVYGLQRAFKSAGVNYLLMSLWKVDDDATQKMMSYFYTALVQNKDVVHSFNMARKELMKRYESPYYWGGFVLVGY